MLITRPSEQMPTILKITKTDTELPIGQQRTSA